MCVLLAHDLWHMVCAGPQLAAGKPTTCNNAPRTKVQLSVPVPIPTPRPHTTTTSNPGSCACFARPLSSPPGLPTPTPTPTLFKPASTPSARRFIDSKGADFGLLQPGPTLRGLFSEAVLCEDLASAFHLVTERGSLCVWTRDSAERGKAMILPYVATTDLGLEVGG